MCRSCLQENLNSLEEFDEHINEAIKEITCECCRSFPLFMKSVNQDFKVLCLTKMKKYDHASPIQIRKTLAFEKAMTRKINEQLKEAMEQLDDQKDEMKNGSYLARANDLASLKNGLSVLEEAEHR